MKTTRKIWSMVICACLLLTMLCTIPCAAEQFGEELVPEGQGEFDGLKEAKEGYFGSWFLKDGAKIAPYNAEDTSEGRDEYLLLESTESTQALATLSYASFADKVASQKTYLVSVSYASETNKQAYIIVYEYAGEDGTGDSHRIDLPSTGGAWKETAFLFTTDKSGSKNVNSFSFNLYCHSYYVGTNGTKTVKFDNISIREVNTAEYDVISRVVVGNETADGYKANDDGNVALQLLPLGWTSTDKAVVTGYVKAAQGESVTVSASTDIALDGTSKIFSGTGEWVPFALKGVSFGNNITVVATGNGAELKNINLEKDFNILHDTTFVSTANGGKWYHSSASDVTVQTDGNCPEGTNYLKVVRSSNQRYASLSGFATHKAGDRYLCSVWYKSDITAAVQIQHKGLESSSPQIDLPATDAWKKIEFVFEMFGEPSGGTVYLWLGIPKGRTEQGTAYFCAPSIEKLSDVKRNGLYAPCGSVMTTTQYTVNTEEVATHMQILGEPVQSAAGLDEVTAVYINGVTPSTGSIVMAAYTKDNRNTKSLVDVTISEAIPNSGVVYPAATMDTSALATGTEIRAFVWNGISGLNALEKAVKATK